jgi:hypothetical protein
MTGSQSTCDGTSRLQVVLAVLLIQASFPFFGVLLDFGCFAMG